jgi:methanogenic corrinoid protein MtbC1
MMDIADQQNKLMEALLQADKEKALQIISEWAEIHTYKNTLIMLFQPVLDMFGELWFKGEISLAQGYVAGLIAEDVFVAASASGEFRNEDVDKTKVAVIGNAEDDYHGLGRKLLIIFLKMAGWQIYDIGNDVVAKDFVDKAVETGASVIGVSAMMYTTANNIRKIREELDARNLTGKIQLAVGGAIFRLRPELCAEVGGDGTADNALEASELFMKLKEVSARYK